MKLRQAERYTEGASDEEVGDRRFCRAVLKLGGFSTF